MAAPKGNKFAVGNLGGRPPKFTKEFCDAEAKAFHEWMELEDSIYFKNFAISRGYSPTCFDLMKEVSEEFSEALKIAQQWQQGKMIQFGLFKKTDAGLTKFLLSAVHGMYDQSQLNQAQQPREPVQITIVDGRDQIQPEAS